MYEFNIELIIESTIKINSNEIQENFQYKKLPMEIDLIKLEIPIIKIDNKNNNILEEKNSSNKFYFIINDVIKNLENKGYQIFPSTQIYIYLNLLNDFILIDSKYNFIYSSILSPINFIKLKLKNVLNKELFKDKFPDLTKNILPIKPDKNFTSRKRKIKEIINILYKRRFLNKGFINNEGKVIKYNLKEAADILGESPKTLNDYLKTIYYGRKTNFDFNKNKDRKISFLRKHNRINTKPNEKGKNSEKAILTS